MTTPFATAGCYTHKDRQYRPMDIQKCLDIARLLAKKLTGSITPEENQQLDEWRLADRRHQELADKLTDEKDYLVHQQELEQLEEPDFLMKVIWANILSWFQILM